MILNFCRINRFAGAFLLLLLVTGNVLAYDSVQERDFAQKFAYHVAAEEYDVCAAVLDTFDVSDFSPVTVPLAKASLLVAQMVDLGENDLLGDFWETNDECCQVLDSLRRVDGRDVLSIHRASGKLAALEAQVWMEVEGKPLKSLGAAKRSAKSFGRALDVFAKDEESHLGLAMYRFWKSQALRFMTWTPLAKDHRGASMDILEAIALSESPNRLAAAIALGWVYIELERFEDATTLLESYLDELPDVRGLLEPCGKAYYLAADQERAWATYSRLLSAVRTAPRRNRAREVGTLHRLAQIAELQKHWGDVIDCADAAEELPLLPELMKQKQDDLEHLRKMRVQAQKALERD